MKSLLGIRQNIGSRRCRGVTRARRRHLTARLINRFQSCDEIAHNRIVVIGINRVHIATFDATESGEYNRENCFTARDLFAGQPGVKVRYWCELGNFRP